MPVSGLAVPDGAPHISAMLEHCTAELIDDGTRFRIRRGAWSNDYPIGELDGWIDFYTRVRADHPKSLTSYDETISALEALKASLQPRE